LTEEDLAALKGYVDGGGALLLTSEQYLNHAALDPAFTSTYLGVDQWSIDRGYMKMTGVEGDPIGGGMDLDLTLPPSVNNPDGAFPGPTAATFLVSPTGDPAGVRNELAAGSRVVFLPWALHGLASEADPDNIATLARRSVEWLMRRSPSGVASDPMLPVASAIVAVQPNPARGRVDIELHLCERDASEPVRLDVFSLDGRRVATAWDGRLEAGARVVTWDGTHRAGGGVYFAVLRTREGSSSRKFILLP
jgi:hypothetical protein